MSILDIIMILFCVFLYKTYQVISKQLYILSKSVSDLKVKVSILNSDLQILKNDMKGFRVSLQETKEAQGRLRTRIASLKRDMLLGDIFVKETEG